MFYNYVLQSDQDSRWYIGVTNDLKTRVLEHNQGLNRSTKPHRPWQLIYYEASPSLDDANRREKYLKTNQGRRLLRLRLKEYIKKSVAVKTI